MALRIDKWLWSVRIFKTRTDATDACKNNRVAVNGAPVKPSKELKEGDIVSVKKMPMTYTFKVLGLISNRQPARNVYLYAENQTPQEEFDKVAAANAGIFLKRDRGTGRPTKKERRDIDGLMDDFLYEMYNDDTEQ